VNFLRYKDLTLYFTNLHLKSCPQSGKMNSFLAATGTIYAYRSMTLGQKKRHRT